MAIPGPFYGSKIGPDPALDYLGYTGVTTSAIPTQNNGWAARFKATQDKDIKSIKINWNTATSPGTVQARIETIDATTGKPTGTLYDAAATKDFTPAAGWQTVTFDVLPTTNLTAGTEYAIVLLTTVTGTAHTLRSHIALGPLASYPLVVLTASDATTRTNFAEVSNSLPIVSLILDDDTEDPMGMLPYAVSTNNNIFGTAGVAMKVTTVGTLSLYAIETAIIKVGTPAGDLRIRIFDSGDNTISNSTITIDKDSLITGASAKRNIYHFNSLVSLTAGTYRVVLDSASSANSSNCWRINSLTPVDTTVVPDNFILSTCPDVGTPSWTDSATADQPPVRLLVDNITAGSSQVGQPASQMLNGQLQR